MPRGYRYALICLLVGCVPPPAGGYPSQTYPRSQYQQPPQHSGDDGDDGDDGNYGNGSGNNGYDSGDGDDGDGDYGNGDSRNGGGSRDGGNRAAPRAAGEWTCSAEASLGTAIGAGSMNYSVKTGYGTASTRAEAETLALKHCGEIVNVSILIADDMRTEVGPCGLSRCDQIGR